MAGAGVGNQGQSRSQKSGIGAESQSQVTWSGARPGWGRAQSGTEAGLGTSRHRSFAAVGKCFAQPTLAGYGWTYSRRFHHMT